MTAGTKTRDAITAWQRQVFTNHDRYWLDNRYVYPVCSRRSKGISIGINLNPDKACNFDCVYCCVNRTIAGRDKDVDLDVVRQELWAMLQATMTGELYRYLPMDQVPQGMRRLNDIAFSGNGEPTTYRRFLDACRLVIEAKREFHLPDCKINVITNATTFHLPRVRRALALLDEHNGEIWAKLDAGTEEYYRLVDRTKFPFAKLLANILDAARVRPIVIQALFVRIHGVGPGKEEIEQFCRRLGEIIEQHGQLKLIQVYTSARETAEQFATPLPDEDLDYIAARVRATIPTPVEVYYGVQE